MTEEKVFWAKESEELVQLIKLAQAATLELRDSESVWSKNLVSLSKQVELLAADCQNVEQARKNAVDSISGTTSLGLDMIEKKHKELQLPLLQLWESCERELRRERNVLWAELERQVTESANARIATIDGRRAVANLTGWIAAISALVSVVATVLRWTCP